MLEAGSAPSRARFEAARQDQQTGLGSLPTAPGRLQVQHWESTQEHRLEGEHGAGGGAVRKGPRLQTTREHQRAPAVRRVPGFQTMEVKADAWG